MVRTTTRTTIGAGTVGAGAIGAWTVGAWTVGALALAVLLPATGASASDRHSDRYHARVKKVCDRNQAAAQAGRGRYVAFARDGQNLHCGWSRVPNWRNARASALQGCKRKAGARCRIVYLKK